MFQSSCQPQGMPNKAISMLTDKVYALLSLLVSTLLPWGRTLTYMPGPCG